MNNLVGRAIAGLLAVLVMVGGILGESGVAWAISGATAPFQFVVGSGSIGCNKFLNIVTVNLTGKIEKEFADKPNFDDNFYIDEARFYGLIDGVNRDLLPELKNVKYLADAQFQNMDPDGIFRFYKQYAIEFSGQETLYTETPVVVGQYSGSVLTKKAGRIQVRQALTEPGGQPHLDFQCGSRDEDTSSIKNTKLMDLPTVIVRQVGRGVSNPEIIKLLREVQKQTVNVRVRVR
jgi:hypothetical protein